MLILKRLFVWFLERSVEACLLGGLFGCLLSATSTKSSMTLPGSLSSFWVLGLVVATVLFMHGYYVTTAFFGVVARSTKRYVYPASVSALFVLHVCIVSLHLWPDITPEARTTLIPFALGGAAIAFFCALGGSRVLDTFKGTRSDLTAHQYAFGLTALIFILANIAHFLRPIVGSSAFRTYGLPFTFYREGGFAKEWVWQPGVFVWPGMIADIAAAGVIVVLLGKALQAVRARK